VAYLASGMIEKLVVCGVMKPFVTTKVAPYHFREYGAKRERPKERGAATRKRPRRHQLAGSFTWPRRFQQRLWLQSRGRLTRLL